MQIPQTEVILTKDGVELTRRVVTPGEYLLGRGDDVDFRMETPLASRHHARPTVNYDEWLVEDLGSSNGTFINDQPVAPHETTRVFPTQTLRVGDATVTLRRLRGSEAPDVSLVPAVAVGRTLAAGGSARAGLRHREGGRAGRDGRDPERAGPGDPARRGDEGHAAKR